MNILVVGSVLKDVYLNLDSRTEQFETDENGVKWLDFSFDASEHRFFSREPSLGGAAVTLEVLSKMGIKTAITGSKLKMEDGDLTSDVEAAAYRYILVTDGRPSYIVPTEYKETIFATPDDFYDYIYIDRSAKLEPETVNRINSYLDLSHNTKLVLYLRTLDDQVLNQLVARANLVFCEGSKDDSEKTSVLESMGLDENKIIYITENKMSYLGIEENVAVGRIDVLTHLSAYSIASATILGGFILGNSVEDSLRMARVNMENARLNSVLSIEELKEISENMDPGEDLELVAANLVLKPKGILAADESGGSIKKKFAQLGIEDTYENRRDYRNIFLSTTDLEKYVNGVILFDETARQQADDGQNFVDYLISRRIIPGVKVDQGLENFENSLETYTKGLDGLAERLKEYYRMGLRFAKWRAAFEIHLNEAGDAITPSERAIDENCRILAEYAKNCQSAGLVPIVEPEVVYDGYYSIEKSTEVTAKILDRLFVSLADFGVNLRACILKCNMVIAGKQFGSSSPDEVGRATSTVLKEHVPEDLAGIVFLSGGQTVEQATDNLAEIIKNGPYPWPVTFSFARALQDPALFTWKGDNNNTEAAKEAFKNRLIANTDALK
ncbi:fructose-bisphosphate aldolase class I [Candidatus Saccharibacteria bacterium]|nr:fructose-bisphosphate aldolase class I [Candidatus Saccharibacteria bacterium]